MSCGAQTDESDKCKAEDAISELQKSLDEQRNAAAALSAQLATAQDAASTAASAAQQQRSDLTSKLDAAATRLVHLPLALSSQMRQDLLCECSKFCLQLCFSFRELVNKGSHFLVASYLCQRF